MTNPLIFHVSWLLIAMAMMGIPIFLCDKFEDLRKTNLRRDIVEFTVFVGGIQLFSVFFGVCTAVAMKEFDPLLCFVIGNIITIILMIIFSRVD